MLRIFRNIFIVFTPLLILVSCGGGGKRIKPITNELVGYNIRVEKGLCIVEADEMDPLTGYRKTDLEKENLFSYTPLKLLKHFEDEPLMTCKANLSKIDKRVLLNLQFIFTSSHLKNNYSGLAEESLLKITLINDENIYLNNIVGDPGRFDNDNRKIFNGLYPLAGSDIKAMKKLEISSISVIWEGGYETYSVHNIDFAMRQLSCIEELANKY